MRREPAGEPLAIAHERLVAILDAAPFCKFSPALLTKRLNELQDCGLIIRKSVPEQWRTKIT